MRKKSQHPVVIGRHTGCSARWTRAERWRISRCVRSGLDEDEGRDWFRIWSSARRKNL